MSDTRKVVISATYGGFGLSWAGMQALAARKGLVASYFSLSPDVHAKVYGGAPVDPDDTFTHRVIGPRAVSAYDEIGNDARAAGFLDARYLDRDDRDLVAVVEELGEAASSKLANLVIVEVPTDAQWHIAEYDGYEHVAEDHRTWP